MKRRKYPQITKKKACLGKKRYTRKEAHQASMALHHSTGDRVSSYKCPFCNSFHVGHTPKFIRNVIDGLYAGL